MDLKKISQFSYKCLNCNTSVCFPVPTPDNTEQLGKLCLAVGKLVCPICNTELGDAAYKAMTAVNKYNAAVIELNMSNAELD